VAEINLVTVIPYPPGRWEWNGQGGPVTLYFFTCEWPPHAPPCQRANFPSNCLAALAARIEIPETSEAWPRCLGSLGRVGGGGCKTPPSLRYLLDYDLLTYLPTPPPSHVFEFHSPTHLRVGKYFFLHLPFPPVFWEFVKFQITLAPPPTPPPPPPPPPSLFFLFPFPFSS